MDAPGKQTSKTQFQKPQVDMEWSNPLEVMGFIKSKKSSPSMRFIARNGIETEMSDMRAQHAENRFRIKLNQRSSLFMGLDERSNHEDASERLHLVW